MTLFIATHAGTILIGFVVALVGTIVALIAVVAHHEKRMQELEHELATLHANNEVANTPSSSEVARRYAAMTEQREAA